MLDFTCLAIVIVSLVLIRLAYDAIRRKGKPCHEKLIEQLHDRHNVTIMVGGRKIECQNCTLIEVQPRRMEMDSGLIVTTYVFKAHQFEPIEE